jgi:hypothetical protein
LFSKQADLNAKTTQLSEFPIDMSTLKNQLQEQFKALYEITKLTEVIRWSCKSAGSKTNQGLDNLEKRLLKAQKRKLSDILERITDLQNELFPNKVCRNVKLIFQILFRKWSNLIPSVIDTETFRTKL